MIHCRNDRGVGQGVFLLENGGCPLVLANFKSLNVEKSEKGWGEGVGQNDRVLSEVKKRVMLDSI